MKRSTWMPKTIETSTWTPKTMKRSTWTSVPIKRSTCTSKTIRRSKSTYNCQEIDLENWEDRRGLFEQCRDYYDIAGRARRYTCLLHYCENYELLCPPVYWNFGFMHFLVYKFSSIRTFWVYALSVLCYPTLIIIHLQWKILMNNTRVFFSVNCKKAADVTVCEINEPFVNYNIIVQ